MASCRPRLPKAHRRDIDVHPGGALGFLLLAGLLLLVLRGGLGRERADARRRGPQEVVRDVLELLLVGAREQPVELRQGADVLQVRALIRLACLPMDARDYKIIVSRAQARQSLEGNRLCKVGRPSGTMDMQMRARR